MCFNMNEALLSTGLPPYHWNCLQYIAQYLFLFEFTTDSNLLIDKMMLTQNYIECIMFWGTVFQTHPRKTDLRDHCSERWVDVA